ncbi:MAG: peptidoglycan-binding domain-containing protein [Rhodospirillales bacterium]|nr:peptidoglycan-binding domain-containing protein [Rhodospirillales bacterium]MDH3791273.1 peptidoglycan-binding domain-containing protein [Rhodospirillales bacterium]MDH3913146.1 peptidoglycan-binding domain-containing protein [Rhodospirillales bacterium]MDH3919950.1 peptidoglycan-binding domain-containing protein [Rhodospirillales bacterium]MDH3966245.1 peptidoglycan-binding domain-containing protein [Rhodospirillales bacterium]
MPFEKPDRFVERLFLHCSASDRPEHDDVGVMRDWHLARGWSDVGYHLFVKKDGHVQAGRDLEVIPAAQAGNNTGTIAVCLHGLAVERFTEAQYRSVIGLSNEVNAAYDGMVTFHGHCEVSSKACPVFPYREVLGLDAHGNMELPQDPTPLTQADTPTVRLMDRGPAARRLQELLNAQGAGLAADGIFGVMTREAVVRFQTDNELDADAIVGPLTWIALGE